MNVISLDQIRKRKEITMTKIEMTSTPLFERIYMKNGQLVYDSGTSKASPFPSKKGSTSN